MRSRCVFGHSFVLLGDEELQALIQKPITVIGARERERGEDVSLITGNRNASENVYLPYDVMALQSAAIPSVVHTTPYAIAIVPAFMNHGELQVECEWLHSVDLSLFRWQQLPMPMTQQFLLLLLSTSAQHLHVCARLFAQI